IQESPMRHSILTAVPLLLLAGLAYAEPKDGMYEVTTTMRMAGMPDIPPQKNVQCLNAKDRVPHPPRPRGGGDCSVVQVKSSGDHVTWHVKCADQRGTLEGDGSLTYTGASFTGSTVLRMTKNGEEMQMTQTMEGHRIGDCPPAAAK